MAEEEQSQEKTEDPSQKRLKESREKGQVARSKDFNSTLILVFSAGSFLLFGQHLSSQLMSVMRQAFDFDSTILTLPDSVIQKLALLMKLSLLAISPLLIMILILTLIAPLLMGGWLFSVESLHPKFSRLNLLKGLKRMVSVKGLVEMLKSFAKFFLLSIVAVLVLKAELPALLNLADYPLTVAIGTGVTMVVKSFLIISASLVLIAAVDVPFQIHEHNKQLKMSKQELRDEYKETEGKPEVKSQIRKVQQEIAKRRMMSEVPKANVVITNPTHFAVALSYDHEGSKAPILVAKGQDLIALQINRVAQANEVPLLSLPPLARALYYSTDINEEIPKGLYVAVAQVLAYVYHLRDKQHYDKTPEILQDLPIPDELRRDAEERT